MLNINGYELLDKIGEGGMSTVWKARQLSLDRLVAIKIMRETSLPNQEARTWFRKEAQNTARLNHPHIVQVFDTGEVNGEAYIVMEYVHGHNVGDEILAKNGIPEARALEITEQVARALAYAWEKECLIHCDIKPDNLLVDGVTGHVKVADLGLARLIGMRASSGNDELIIGTPNYTAPEQSAGLTDLDCRTDMYSLGATLYHMATGVLPFRGAAGSEAMNRHEQDFLEDPQTVNPDLSTPTAWLIEKLMIKNRALRSHFWTQTLKDIEAVRKGNMPFPPLPEPGASTVRRAATRKMENIQVRSASPAAAAPKLILKKAAAPSMSTSPAKKRTSSKSGFLAWLIIGAALAAAYYLYKDKLPLPQFPFLQKPQEAESGAAISEETADEGTGTIAQDTASAPRAEQPGAWQNDDFNRGAALFNQALKDYIQYQQTRQNPAILAQVEENCRTAIAHFEACRADAPPSVNVSEYITRCYEMISNVRQSTTLGMTDDNTSASGVEPSSPPAPKPGIVIRTLDTPTAPATAPAQPSPAGPKIVFVDEETPATPSSAPSPAAPQTTTTIEPKPMLRLALDPAWSESPSDAGGIADEMRRLLARHAEPTRDLMIDASVVLYPGIHCMMTAQEAAKVIGQNLPVRRAITTPGLPANSLFYYEFEGAFGWANKLTLVVERNGRVVMSQLYDDRPAEAHFEPALYSANWNVITFVNVRRRADGDGPIAHRVRRADSLIRIDTELAAPPPDAGGPRMAAARAQLLMPAQLAGLILQTGK